MDLAKDKEKLKHAWLYEAEAEFKQVGTQKRTDPTEKQWAKSILSVTDLEFKATIFTALTTSKLSGLLHF